MITLDDSVVICSFICYIPIVITYVLIAGILCLDCKLIKTLKKTKVQCGVVRDFLYILVTIQALLMIVLGVQKYDVITKIGTYQIYDFYFEFNSLAFTYVDLIFHASVSLGFLYYLRHRNLTDSEKRKIIHCKNKQQEKE